MRPADATAALLRELEALPPRKRQNVLSALTPGERERLEGLIASQGAVAGTETFAMSPWLTARIACARSSDQGLTVGVAMTPAARNALAKCAKHVPAMDERQMPLAIAGRSLLSTVGHLLSSRTAR